MANEDNESNGSFTCQRCGRCCKEEVYLVSRFTEEDWVGIIRYLQEKKRWSFTIHDFDKDEGPWKIDIREGTPEELAHEFMSADLGTTIGDALDTGRCPFVRKAANQPYYMCTVQEAKPVLCAAFSCEGHQYARDVRFSKEEGERFRREYEERCIAIARQRGYKQWGGKDISQICS